MNSPKQAEVKQVATQAIAVKNLSIELGGRTILNDISFAIGNGEFIAVLGPNGAGKSTLFKLLLGTLKPTSGSISVLGNSPRRGNQDIGYAPQHRVLEADVALRARDVVGFGLDGHRWGIGLGSRARDELIDTVLREVDAAQFADAPVGQLSGGEQQRLLIAQALITNPKILLLDEPLSNLDISHVQEIVALLTKICSQRHVTILLVSHDINPLIGAATRVLYLANGHSAMGTTDEIITSEMLSKLYDANVEVIKTAGRIFVVGAEI